MKALAVIGAVALAAVAVAGVVFGLTAVGVFDKELSATPSAAALRSAASCKNADVSAPFARLPRSMKHETARQAIYHLMSARFPAADGKLEVREVRVNGQVLAVGVTNGVDDPQVFANAFISGERNPDGGVPREIRLNGKQTALVPLRNPVPFSYALLAFMKCRALLILGDSGNEAGAMGEVGRALLSDDAEPKKPKTS